MLVDHAGDDENKEIRVRSTVQPQEGDEAKAQEVEQEVNILSVFKA